MLLWAEGFENDWYYKKRTADGSYCSVSNGDMRSNPSTSSRTGTYGFMHGPNPASSYLVKIGPTLQGSGRVFTVGVAVYFYNASAAGNSFDLIHFLDSSGITLMTLRKDVGGFTFIRTPSGVNVVAVSGMTFTSGIWYYLEVRAKAHSSAGEVEVRWDNVPILVGSGLNTSSNWVVDTIRFFGSAVYTWYSDDIYITNDQGSNNTGFLGAVKVEMRVPTGAGATTQGVPSSGSSNWDLVNDLPTNTIGYVDLANTGDEDTYAYGDLTSPYVATTPVKGVFVWANGIKTDAGGRNVSPVARLSGTEVAGAAVPMVASTSLSGAVPGGVFETKPGGGDWTVADVNSAEFGMRAS